MAQRGFPPRLARIHTQVHTLIHTHMPNAETAGKVLVPKGTAQLRPPPPPLPPFPHPDELEPHEEPVCPSVCPFTVQIFTQQVSLEAGHKPHGVQHRSGQSGPFDRGDGHD